MKRYVYLTKEDGLLFLHHIMAENRLDVKKKTGACIDNIYSVDLLIKVNKWLEKYGKTLAYSDIYEVSMIEKENKIIHHMTNFVEFRNIVSEYRKR